MTRSQIEKIIKKYIAYPSKETPLVTEIVDEIMALELEERPFPQITSSSANKCLVCGSRWIDSPSPTRPAQALSQSRVETCVHGEKCGTYHENADYHSNKIPTGKTTSDWENRLEKKFDEISVDYYGTVIRGSLSELKAFIRNLLTQETQRAYERRTEEVLGKLERFGGFCLNCKDRFKNILTKKEL